MNVLGEHSIAKYTRELAGFATRREVKEWVARVLPKHIKRSPELLIRLRTETQVRNGLGNRAPRELLAKILDMHSLGTQFLGFDAHGAPARELHEQVRSVIDWLDAVPDWDRHLRRVSRMSYLDAARLSEDWHRRLFSLLPDDTDVVEELREIADLGDGNRLVELVGPVALLREGALMGHCVGGRGYVQAVRQGSTRIFSLRDKANHPHVTIELRQRTAHQIKGKENKPPVERWAQLVRPFIKSQNWRVTYDGFRIGLMTIGNRTIDQPDEIIDACLDFGLNPRKSLTGMLPDGALELLQRRASEISPGARSRLIEGLCGATLSVETVEDGVVVEGPGGLAVRRLKHVLPAVLIDALNTGLMVGAEDRVVDVIGAQLDSIFAQIARSPSDMHQIEVYCMAGDRRNILDQAAAFTGRLPVLTKLRDQVNVARRQRLTTISAAIRQSTSPSLKVHQRSTRSWVAELNQVQAIQRDGVEQARKTFAAGTII